jgi:hypothetical protein
LSILRIETDQDIYGYGEVRDGGEVKTALVLKGLLLGKNHCNVEEIFKTIKPYGGLIRDKVKTRVLEPGNRQMLTGKRYPGGSGVPVKCALCRSHSELFRAGISPGGR